MPRFLRLYTDYSKERALSKERSDSYDPMVQAHFEAAEGYEHAQLIAEIGIVLASLGVLLNSRASWLVSIVPALVCVVQIGRTNVRMRHKLAEAEEHVHHSAEAYHELRKARTGVNEDERTVEALDPGGKLRAENEANAATMSRMDKHGGASEQGEAAEHKEAVGH